VFYIESRVFKGVSDFYSKILVEPVYAFFEDLRLRGHDFLEDG
jgi:hypothetical protein